MPALLCSLGTSWAVAPEAFLLGNGDARYASVSILTTSGTTDAVARCREWFAEHAPACRLHIHAIEELPDIARAEDHERFEEALFRVAFSLAGESGGFDRIDFCLAGGFKTISSAVHQAADLLGCRRLFHITAPFGIKIDTDAEIRTAIDNGNLRLIDLGPRPGWPTIQALGADTPPPAEPFVIDDTRLRDRVINRLRDANHLSQSESQLATLPFPQLARCSPGDRDWLAEPLEPGDEEWIRSLPKVDLHCHLGGFATHGAALAEVRAAASDPDKLPNDPEPPLPTGWPRPDEPIGLEHYRSLGDATGSKLLQDPGCLKRHIELLCQHFQEQNIRYAEVRCSPANYASHDRTAWDVLTEIRQHFADAATSVATSVPLVEPVAAGVPPVEPVAGVPPVEPVAGVPLVEPVAGVPPVEPVAGDPPAASSPPPRTFIPYRRHLAYRQTWRDLPHRQQSGATAFVTFRLDDSLPAKRLEEWNREKRNFLEQHPKPWSLATWKTYRRRFPERLETWLDQAHGRCVLRDPDCAGIVAEALRHFDGDRYILDAFVVMPNHVHVLFKPLGDHRIDRILHSWKSFTAKEINARLGRQGTLWQHESFDHLVRSWRQLELFRRYIGENPEKAGLGEGFLCGHGRGLVSPPPPPGETPADTAPPPRRARATRINLIIIATRQPGGDYRTQISRHLALAATAFEHWTDPAWPRVVGVDLAGYEDKQTRAHYYREDFMAALRLGMGITVHAGENDDAEAIWSAILDLNARRLGHALHLARSPSLLRNVADRHIGVEMCPYANLQIVGFPLDPPTGDPGRYPLQAYLEAGAPVTVNTDNIGISAASLTDNFLLLPRLCPGITRLDVLRLIRNAVDQAFISASERNALLARLHIPTTP